MFMCWLLLWFIATQKDMKITRNKDTVKQKIAIDMSTFPVFLNIRYSPMVSPSNIGGIPFIKIVFVIFLKCSMRPHAINGSSVILRSRNYQSTSWCSTQHAGIGIREGPHWVNKGLIPPVAWMIAVSGDCRRTPRLPNSTAAGQEHTFFHWRLRVNGLMPILALATKSNQSILLQR
jgi:hypothetical protein